VSVHIGTIFAGIASFGSFFQLNRSGISQRAQPLDKTITSSAANDRATKTSVRGMRRVQGGAGFSE
jgi:hypothetical protein